MSHMFDNYTSFDLAVKPDNVHKKPPKPHNIFITSNPLNLLYDENHKLVGYSWDYGEVVTIPVSVNLVATVHPTSIWSDVIGEEPPEVGSHLDGQCFYNTVDVRSWKFCCGEWQEDPLFTFPSNGMWKLPITPNMFGKKLVVTIDNFRYENLFTFEYEDVNDVDVEIDAVTSKKLKKGLYTMDVRIVTDTSNALVSRYQLQVY